jgi:hypothetical protein
MSKQIYLVEIESNSQTHWMVDEKELIHFFTNQIVAVTSVLTKGSKPRVTVTACKEGIWINTKMASHE